MHVTTTQIVYGPGRFLPIGTTVDLPPREAHDLVNRGQAVYVDGPYGVIETADERRPVEMAALFGSADSPSSKPLSRPKSQGK